MAPRNPTFMSRAMLSPAPGEKMQVSSPHLGQRNPLMFSISPSIGTSSRRQKVTHLRTSAAATVCGVVAITAPSRKSSCCLVGRRTGGQLALGITLIFVSFTLCSIILFLVATDCRTLHEILTGCFQRGYRKHGAVRRLCGKAAQSPEHVCRLKIHSIFNISSFGQTHSHTAAGAG